MNTIDIKGIPYEEGTSFLKKYPLEITASDGKTYTTDLNSGFEPKPYLIDLNHDGIADCLLVSLQAEAVEFHIIFVHV